MPSVVEREMPNCASFDIEDTIVDSFDLLNLDKFNKKIIYVDGTTLHPMDTLLSNNQANGPTTNAVQNLTYLGFLADNPHAFMAVGNSKKPVIFDTGASLAITPEIADFDSPLTIPEGELWLGGVAKALHIEGVGVVTWSLNHTDGTEMAIQSSGYFVTKAKAQILSPQQLFDKATGIKVYYRVDHHSFQLVIDGCAPLVIDYDECNSLPIGYATIGTHQAPQFNLALLDDNNQNLTGGQKILLHWHAQFGHLNLPAVQSILRTAPFLTATFKSASSCDFHNIKCSTCEYAKGHRRPKQSSSTTPNTERIGALKVNHLHPGIQVSVDHFESRLLGRTFDSFGKASSDTFKGGCIVVDHCTGFLHVEHQLGFSAVEKIRAKQSFEQMALDNGVIIQFYLTDSGAFQAMPLSLKSAIINRVFVTVAIMHITKME